MFFFSFCLKFLSSIDVFLPIFSLCKYFGLEHNCKMCIWCSLIGTVHIVTTTSPYVFNCITFIISWPLYPALRYGLWSLLMSYSDLYLRRLVYCRKLSCWQSNYIFLSWYCLYFRRLFFLPGRWKFTVCLFVVRFCFIYSRFFDVKFLNQTFR